MNTITDALIELDEDRTLRLVEQALVQGERSLPIVSACEQAMRVIGERYQREEYFLSGLILAGEIFREVLALIRPGLEGEMVGHASGTVLLGTVAGDIHDIGKNLTATTLRGHGFTVIDLGVDVPPRTFLDAAVTDRPDIVGLSGLITAAFESMRATTTALKSADELALKPHVILGGGIVDAELCRFCGADSWTNNAMEGVRICQGLLAARHGASAADGGS